MLNTLQSCIVTTLTDSVNVYHLSIRLPSVLMILGHLLIKLWTLETFACGIQISHTLVRRNPLSLGNV